MELNEGDTIKIGGSTRLYKLHWIPMTRAYDMESPYVSSLDVPMEEEKEEESAVQSHQVRVCETVFYLLIAFGFVVFIYRLQLKLNRKICRMSIRYAVNFGI